jgi:hypothetical protein
VSDGQASASLAPFSINVAATNRPPTISGVPATSVNTGQGYSFRPTASDPDNQTLTFSISGKPAWASFDAVTGALSGTPTSTQAGTYPNIVVSVSDGQASASLAPFSINVAATNRPPTISGVPATSVEAGKLYSFTPTASDPDGQTLTFSIANKPSWAAFDSRTGRLSGTPGTTNVGTTSSVTITVSDGQVSASLAPFSVQVTAPPVTGSVTLSWTAPTENVDGTPLENLAGYRVRYGQSSSNLSSTVQIPSSTMTSAVIENLAAGTWYFAVKAYTTASVESDLSNVASKTIN